jgi:cysteinyl-tRNA synthetase
VLWKAAKPEDEAVGAAWNAPFGRGRPGWHIECSAMALELIGQQWETDVLDIHAGGVDLIFPHHEDEIAQSCAYTGRELFARFWLHGEFLDIEGTKMSKRYGNVLTPRDLREDGIPAEAIRHLMFGTHYRKKLDWSDEALAASQEASRRLGEFQNRLSESASELNPPAVTQAAKRLTQNLEEALDDDLNAPRALAALFAFMKEANAAMDAGEDPGPLTTAAWEQAEGVLGVATPYQGLKVTGHAPTAVTTWSEIPPADSGEESQKNWALFWAVERKKAKSSRDYSEADRIRAFLRTAGWEVRDKPDGSVEVVRIKRAS